MRILQGLCPTAKPLAGFYKAFFVLGPPPNTWETSERLLPLSTAKLNHLGLLALSVASRRSQDLRPVLLSPADNLHFVRPCLYL